MINSIEVITVFENEIDHNPKLALKNLTQILLLNPNETELLDLLFGYFEESSVNYENGREIIFDLLDLRDIIPKEYTVKLCLLEALLRYIYDDLQTTWETLANGLMHHPENEQILKEIEKLNQSPIEAPLFNDYLETIAELVAQEKFSKDTFDYLLLVCANPNKPTNFDVAKKIATKTK